ncbi:MAG: glycosyltransferase family 4 protein [Bacteroidota bacterium]
MNAAVKKKALMLAVCSPDAIGGQAACARMLLNHFDAVEWTAISFPLPEKYNSFGRLMASIGIILRSTWICITKKISVVHILSACSRSALFEKLIIARVLKMTGVKVVINFQGALDFYYARYSLREKRFVRNELSRIDVLLCLHDGMKNFLVSELGMDAKKIRVIANAVTIEPEIEKVKSNDHVVRLVYFGGIVGSKGVDVLIKACAILKKQHSEIKFSLDIIGPEVEKGLINKLKALSEEEGIAQLVKFHPPVTGVGRNVVFASTDIFVFPTRMEGFPFVLLEAMQASLPVVTTDLAPMNLVIEHGVNGMLFEKDNATDFATKIYELTIDGYKMSMIGKAARQHVVANYNLEKIIESYENLYDEL